MINVETLLEEDLYGIYGGISEEENMHGLPIPLLLIDLPRIGRYQAINFWKLRELLRDQWQYHKDDTYREKLPIGSMRVDVTITDRSNRDD